MPLPPAAVLAASGGIAPFRHLAAVTGRSRLRRAVADGEVVRLSRGRYALPGTGRTLGLALGPGGCLSHISAAQHHGWGVLRRWDATCITLQRGRHPTGAVPVRWSYAPLSPAEVAAGVTDPVRTVLDCARTLPFAQALAVADSALRSGQVHPVELRDAVHGCRSPGVGRARRVLAHADARAANPFESGLRAIVLETGLTGFVPQLVVAQDGLFACVDLGDPERKVAFEADGFTVHGDRRAFAADLARHDDLQTAGWVTRRFALEHVYGRAAWVAEQVVSAAGQRLVPAPQQHKGRPARPRTAA